MPACSKCSPINNGFVYCAIENYYSNLYWGLISDQLLPDLIKSIYFAKAVELAAKDGKAQAKKIEKIMLLI